MQLHSTAAVPHLRARLHRARLRCAHLCRACLRHAHLHCARLAAPLSKPSPLHQPPRCPPPPCSPPSLLSSRAATVLAATTPIAAMLPPPCHRLRASASVPPHRTLSHPPSHLPLAHRRRACCMYLKNVYHTPNSKTPAKYELRSADRTRWPISMERRSKLSVSHTHTTVVLVKPTHFSATARAVHGIYRTPCRHIPPGGRPPKA